MAKRLYAALGLLTLVTGLVDATSVLGLGRVFVANMTGNIVFLGFSFAGAHGVESPLVFLVSLAGFLGGAAVTARLTRTIATFRRALAVEIVLFLAANAVLWLAPDARVALVATLAAAMGAQTACVRRLAVADMTTTVLTLTLAGLAADTGAPRLGRRLASVGLMLAGGVVGALLLELDMRFAVGAAAALAILAAAAAPDGATSIDSWTSKKAPSSSSPSS